MPTFHDAFLEPDQSMLQHSMLVLLQKQMHEQTKDKRQQGTNERPFQCRNLLGMESAPRSMTKQHVASEEAEWS